MHGAFNEKIADLQGKKKNQNKQHNKIKIAVFHIIKNNISNNTSRNKYIESLPLHPIRNIHIGISAGFNIPDQPNNDRDHYDQQYWQKVI